MFIIVTIIFVAAIIVSAYSTIAAFISGKPQHYWLATISIYIFSFIAGFSIGQITVGITFVLLPLAIGSSFKWIKNRLNFSICLGVGLLVGILMVVYVDDYWLFFPFTLFS
jgi:uncharacterized membrane protein